MEIPVVLRFKELKQQLDELAKQRDALEEETSAIRDYVSL
jgi:hypothetical protein